MNTFVATFYTHFAAMCAYKQLQKAGVNAKLAPAPRKISKSCGTCVIYSSSDKEYDKLDTDIEAVYLLENDEYICVFQDDK